MNIKKILLPQKDDKQIKKLFDSFDCRPQDLIMLVKDCKHKLLIYDQVISKKIKLLNDYKQLHAKVDQLSPGAFEQFEYQYKREKADEKSKPNKKYKAPPNDNIMIKTTINTILIKVIQNIQKKQTKDVNDVFFNYLSCLSFKSIP